jgi:hypothetical protein
MNTPTNPVSSQVPDANAELLAVYTEPEYMVEELQFFPGSSLKVFVREVTSRPTRQYFLVMLTVEESSSPPWTRVYTWHGTSRYPHQGRHIPLRELPVHVEQLAREALASCIAAAQLLGERLKS